VMNQLMLEVLLKLMILMMVIWDRTEFTSRGAVGTIMG
jgi:hypothetical protein